MYSVIVRPKVAGFKAWHTAFTGFARLNARYGAKNPEVFGADGDPEEFTVRQDFETRGEVQKILVSEDIRVALGEAGVVGHRSVLIAQRAG